MKQNKFYSALQQKSHPSAHFKVTMVMFRPSPPDDTLSQATNAIDGTLHSTYWVSHPTRQYECI